MTDVNEKDIMPIEGDIDVEEKAKETAPEEVAEDVVAEKGEEVIEESAETESTEVETTEKPKKKLGEKWEDYVAKHPKLEKTATYIKEHKTMLQAILFMLFSCLAFVAQLGTQALFDWALSSVDKVVKVWPFPEQALGTLISFLIANVVA